MPTSRHDHDRHIAEALNAFYQEHGDEDCWTPEEVRWHDLLLARVDRQDGYPPVVDGHEVVE